MFIVFPSMLKNAPMFKRINIWRKYKGHPPQNLGTATGPRGQAAAIIRKGATHLFAFQLCNISSYTFNLPAYFIAVQRQDAFGVR
jgi:hypothetical protein